MEIEIWAERKKLPKVENWLGFSNCGEVNSREASRDSRDLF